MPASACKVLGLRVYTTSPCLNICFICLPISLLSFIAHPALFLTSSFVPFPGSLSTPNSPRPLHVICIPMHFLFFSSPLKSLYTLSSIFIANVTEKERRRWGVDIGKKIYSESGLFCLVMIYICACFLSYALLDLFFHLTKNPLCVYHIFFIHLSADDVEAYSIS